MRSRSLVLLATVLHISHALSRPNNLGAKLRTLDPSSSQLPPCAAPCFATGISESPCTSTNITCICLHTASISAAMAPCLLASCPTIDQLHTHRYVAVVCDAPVRDDSSWMIISIWTLFSFAFTSVVLRFISRTPYFGVRLGWDDWTILVLLVLQIPLNITVHYCVRNGFGQDIWMLEEYQIVAIFKAYYSPNLQMTFKKKLVVAFIFLAGFVVTGISIARFVVFKQTDQANFTLTVNAKEKVCASVPAVVSLIRWLNGKRNTTKDSYGTPGGSTAIGPSFNSDRKKGSRDRWHGFTDVFSTNDEFELLEDSIAEESSPQTSSHNRHSRSSDQATDHGPQLDNETPFYGVYPGRTM
ncbi:hypothetical protein J7T55_005594 [Diaporthe amygdali]|uniref:uncharacterized protein n=1 Tax=Phomopsis amygdali TaxID=1214568 RepID=UPI0022FE7A42|nr:uncharacterized protein J7T55_005594 [Diaporthe amygdali]KAJ0124256.1 hypothetical protein J7T55_005594 [Diaporthe amygdali]